MNPIKVSPIRPALLAALAVLCVASSACTGLYVKLPDQAADEATDIKVTPITRELIAAKPALTAASNGHLAGALPSTYVYRVGVGDILDLSIPSVAAVPNFANVPAPPAAARESDRGFSVAPDGTIYLPYVGPLKVAGLSIREVQDEVVKQLGRYLKSPQVSVSVLFFS